MTYDKQDWALGPAGGTPFSDVRMDHMEDGIEAAHQLLEGKAAAVHAHTSADITDATPLNEVDTVVKRDNEGGIAVTRITGLSTATSGTHAVPKSQLDAGLASKAASVHTHAVADISGASVVGIDLLTAATAGAARSAIGAGTSSLALGTTSSTAAAGNHTHPAPAVPTPTFTKVVHGSTASTARPDADYVLWQGSVQPTNWIDGDDWEQV